MGVFWPLDGPAQALRLAALVGAVAGCCAVADRETRYRMLRALYRQLRRLDEAAAAALEAAEDTESNADKMDLGGTMRRPRKNPRDTRSFASDSTAFSRAESPQQQHSHHHHLEHAPARTDGQLVSTPEAVTQLGEALSRLQLITDRAAPAAQSPQPYTPSPLEDVLLLPLATAGPQTPLPESTPLPEPTSKAANRLPALPNPNAPAIKPTTLNGRPQLFEYARPADAHPPPPALRRERAHVELETAVHDSYGFVSNPSALVPALAGQGAALGDAGASAAADGDHYLFVCVKCHRQSTNEVCEKICSDEDGVLRCKLRPGNGQLMEDMEDLVMPMTPKMYTDGRRKTTGRMLYENLKALHAQHERMKDAAACRGSAPHEHADGAVVPRGCPNAVKSRLRIVPVNCLSMCHLGNVIALTAPGKFGYQFGAMHEDDSEDMQAILQFAEDYIESTEGFTKNKTRPPRLSRNILSRIPPPLPIFTSIAE
ncbi:hypothetical protein H4R18_002220 [Coemansia javaensis]|uniref:Uncharacterized protein n=1 Tax=Coemansia javaensis TaxID=2761396 RepID=A0A9W8HDJ7_9FUNG|nr:hypothetical protein H4R18_002220 [Coemansia javaensis]